MNPVIGHIIGWSLVVVTLWLIVTTVVHAHKHVGISTVRGFLWLLAVIVGSLFGVVLYRFFREQVEYACETLFEKWSV